MKVFLIKSGFWTSKKMAIDYNRFFWVLESCQFSFCLVDSSSFEFEFNFFCFFSPRPQSKIGMAME
jgi:hypothetical protein